MRTRRGFTLIELMIVVAIIGIVIAIAIPSGMKAAEESRKTVCINNLRQISAAKDTWALMNHIAEGDAVVVEQVDEFLKKPARCPIGGIYTYGTVGQKPTCSLGASHGHVLPPFEQ